MHESAKEYYREVKKLYTYHVKNLLKMRGIIEKTSSQEELLDWILALNHSNKFIDEMRKNLNALEELAEKIACLLYIQSGSTEPIRTQYASGTPDVKLIASLPKRRTQLPEWQKLMSWLGVPAHLVEIEDQHAVDLHYPGLMAHLTRLVSEGKPLPPGIDPNKMYPEYHITLRPRKGVDEQLDAPVETPF